MGDLLAALGLMGAVIGVPIAVVGLSAYIAFKFCQSPDDFK